MRRCLDRWLHGSAAHRYCTFWEPGTFLSPTSFWALGNLSKARPASQNTVFKRFQQRIRSRSPPSSRVFSISTRVLSGSHLREMRRSRMSNKRTVLVRYSQTNYERLSRRKLVMAAPALQEFVVLNFSLDWRPKLPRTHFIILSLNCFLPCKNNGDFSATVLVIATRRQRAEARKRSQSTQDFSEILLPFAE